MCSVKYGFRFLWLSLFVLSCSTSPTGRKQLTLIDKRQMNNMGNQSFAQLKKSKPRSTSQQQVKGVRCITDHLLKAMGESPQAWEIEVFKDDSPNAFALPGKNMGVHSGLIDLVQNQDQLAAVIGHEIGHVIAEHGNERVSQQVVIQAGLAAGQIALGQDSTQDRIILGALGLGAQFGVLLPFSRKHETEADNLGIEYMAKAGFDPRQAPELWKLMKQKAGGNGPPEFLSTHPSPDSRIKDLNEAAPHYMGLYQAVSQKPRCKL